MTSVIPASIRSRAASDAEATLRKLVDVLPSPDGRVHRFHQAETIERLAGSLYQGPDESTSDAIDPRILAVALDRLLPGGRTLVLDAGRFMMVPGRYMHVDEPASFRMTNDVGAVGCGQAVALGAAIARTTARTVLFIGDGGLSMTLGDLETVARSGLPLLVIVLNDQSYGAERQHLIDKGLPLESSDLADVDFAAVAQALSMEAGTVRTLHELHANASLLASAGPALLDCKILRKLDNEAWMTRW